MNCNVILDLIPLVKDGVASVDSASLVHQHIKICPSCMAEYEGVEITRLEQAAIKDEKIIYAIKQRIFITQLIILTVGAMIGVALSNSMAMFYNLIIMPVIGGIALLMFKKKWYIALLFIFTLTYLWQTISVIVVDGFTWYALYPGLFYSTIYTFLVGLGMIISILLSFTFSKEGGTK